MVSSVPASASCVLPLCALICPSSILHSLDRGRMCVVGCHSLIRGTQEMSSVDGRTVDTANIQAANVTWSSRKDPF